MALAISRSCPFSGCGKSCLKIHRATRNCSIAIISSLHTFRFTPYCDFTLSQVLRETGHGCCRSSLIGDFCEHGSNLCYGFWCPCSLTCLIILIVAVLAPLDAAADVVPEVVLAHHLDHLPAPRLLQERLVRQHVRRDPLLAPCALLRLCVACLHGEGGATDGRLLRLETFF